MTAGDATSLEGPDAAVDLVYLDRPFNSNRDDNVIFRDESGKATTELRSPPT
jgi:hypothetical protein